MPPRPMKLTMRKRLETVSPGDLKEDLIHSLQKYVEVDEPESESVPLIGGSGVGVDADDTEVTTDRMSEEARLELGML